MSRDKKNSMIENGLEMSRRYKMILNESKVKTISNNFIDMVGDTFCIHGDTNNSHILLNNFYVNYFFNDKT